MARSRSNRGMVEVCVAGDKEVDDLMNGLPIKLQKKYWRKATREASKENLKDFRSLVDVDTGALQRTATVRAIKRTRGAVGAMVYIDREKLILERAARGGEIGWDHKRNEPYFYAAQVEFDEGGPKPLRTALYEGAARTRRIILEALNRMIRQQIKEARKQIREALAAVEANA